MRKLGNLTIEDGKNALNLYEKKMSLENLIKYWIKKKIMCYIFKRLKNFRL